jgi:hypothetical protein
MIDALGPWTRCFACGHTHNLEMCPQRYLSPHNEDHMAAVAQAMMDLGWTEEMDPKTQWEIHKQALEKINEGRGTDPRQDLQDAGG